MSPREYAKSRGISRTAVMKYIHSGVLNISVWKNKQGHYRILPGAADEERRDSRHPSYGHAAANGKKSNGSNDHRVDPSDRGSLAELKRRKEMINIQKGVIELKKLQGTLVDRADVNKLLFEFGKMIRERLLAIPDRVVDDLLASDTRAEAHRFLYAALEDELRALSNMEFIDSKIKEDG